jgi:hypothetical protein
MDVRMSSDRRRSPRIELVGRLHGHVVSMGVPVSVREISIGGLSMETPFAFPVGAIHDFRLTLGDGSAVDLRGRVVYSRVDASATEPTAFVTGVQFVDDDVSGDGGVEELIGRIT